MSRIKTNPFQDQPKKSRYAAIYVDGSYVRLPAKGMNQKPQGVIGWGLVALHDNKHHERVGTMHVEHRHRLSGYYELLGIVQAILYVYENMLDLKNVVIFCDDALYGYSQTFLDPNNNLGAKAEVIRERVRHLCDHAFDDHVYHMVIDALTNVRMVKLKGHRGQVYQSRADYLARTTACNLAQDKPARYGHEKFNAWIKQGIPYESNMRSRRVRYLPFVNPPEPTDPEVDIPSPEIHVYEAEDTDVQTMEPSLG